MVPKARLSKQTVCLIWLCMCLLVIRGEASDLRGSSTEKKKKKGGSKNKKHSSRPRTRKERFPSVEQRVQIYMSNWYAPPCSDEQKYRFHTTDHAVTIQNTNMTIRPRITPDMLFWLQEEIVRDCARTKEQVAIDQESSINLATEQFVDPNFRYNMFLYCSDVVELFEILHHMPESSSLGTPYLMQFGDMKHSHDFGVVEIPHFRKFRSATDNLESSSKCVHGERTSLATAHDDKSMQPIVWKLASPRHFKHLPLVASRDTPWHLKKDMAIFRGQLTGSYTNYDASKTVQENCDNMVRCRLVQHHHKSTLIDAKLTTTRKRLPNSIGGVEMVGPKIGIRDQMQYKGLIMLEGNDVASGLKWALLSQSVVLMPKPKHTSWAMEELLEPWVHYVPLNDMATDVEEKMQWVIDHDEEARKIAERASLWIEDLVFHPDAARDDRLVKEEMIRRYRAHFLPSPPKAEIH